MTTNTDAAMPELPEPNICEVTMGAHRGTLSYYTAQDLLDYARAKQSQRELIYESLLKQCVGQLKAWHSKYGENGPSWLPPGGDVRLMETIDDWLNSAPEYPIPSPRAIQQAAGDVPEGRSDKDYAIEHAEYMAKAAEQLAYSVDALDAAHLLDGETPGGADDAVNEAEANYIDARKALSSAVYEFRKRRDRAAIRRVL